MAALVRFALVVGAVAAALAPLPAAWVERGYSRMLYPALQQRMTAASNLVTLALFDVLVGAGVLVTVIWLRRRVRARRKTGWLRTGVRMVWDAAAFAAVVYLLFLALWGLNYRRIPLEEKIEYHAARVTADAALQLARDSVARVNALHADAHRPGAGGRTLEDAFAAAQRRLGAASLAVTGIPKRSLLEWYFRYAAIDGMTDPFFLEVIVNPDVLPVEYPFVVAHEWSHLAGYADEAEANLLAWLTCLEGDPAAQYSGWLAIYSHVMGNLPRADAAAIAHDLAPGPRADIEAIRSRLDRASPSVRAASRDAYDAYLRANRVEEGIASYDTVVRLILGTGAENGWAPRVRARQSAGALFAPSDPWQ